MKLTKQIWTLWDKTQPSYLEWWNMFELYVINVTQSTELNHVS